jgi:hypothetical protein
MSRLALVLMLLIALIPATAPAQPTKPGPKPKTATTKPAAAKSSPAKKAKDAKKAPDPDEQEIDDDDDDDDSSSSIDMSKAPFTAAQRKFLEAWQKQIEANAAAKVQPAPPRTLSLAWRAETYTKILYRNNQSQGSVSYGTPHPRGDNYTGENGFASEITLYIDGKVSKYIDVGARIKSRFHRQWAEFYENGDLAIDPETGNPRGADGTGESLGMNHAGYIQLRGLYVQVRPPIPTIKSFRAGSSDLGMYNAWTVGKVRYIDRDNANGLFLDGEIPWIKLDYHIGRISLPKLFASAGYNSGFDDSLVGNPFWTRDATYVLKLSQKTTDSLDWTLIGSYLIDEEADLNDPDSLGSTNDIDRKDGVVATLPRYQNVNATLDVNYQQTFKKLSFEGNLLLAYSFSDPDLAYVENDVDRDQGFSPIPMKKAHGYAIKARADLNNLFDIGLDIRIEYFNISADWVATFGARRETDVLLTDGFIGHTGGGQVPTLNIANEFIDFRDPFYEAIIGWHGATISPKLTRNRFEFEGEFTFIEYNTDKQDRCTGATITDEAGVPIGGTACPQRNKRAYGVYPDFLYPDGMFDTDFWSYANTNDRGRDPRAVYKQNQARNTLISVLKFGYLFNVGRGLKLDLYVKYIRDVDKRDKDISNDDYEGNLLFTRTQLSTQIADGLSVRGGFRFDYWDEKHRSGKIVGGTADYPDYRTLKTNLFFDITYQLGPATFAWYMEWLNKDVTVSRNGVEDDRASFTYKNIVRGIGTISTRF